MRFFGLVIMAFNTRFTSFLTQKITIHYITLTVVVSLVEIGQFGLEI